MHYRHEPTQETINAERDALRAHKFDPAAYWEHLASSLISASLIVSDSHHLECRRDPCRTCSDLARLRVMVYAHAAVQPANCFCDEHLTYPRTPRKGRRR